MARGAPTAGPLTAASAPVTDAAGPSFEDVRRRERLLLAALVAVVLVIGVVGWLAIPSDETLLERAAADPDHGTRIEAMNALIHRGYWEERPTRELRRFLKDQPEEVRTFVRTMHPNQLDVRRDQRLPGGQDAER